MNILRWGSHMLSRTTPAGLIITGVTVAFAMPLVRRGLRSAALLAAKGVLAVTDQTKSVVARLKEDTEDFMAEARTTELDAAAEIDEKLNQIKHRARRHRHRILAATATGVVAISDKANDLKHEFQNTIEEAKSRRSQRNNAPEEQEEYHHDLDAQPT